MLHLAAPTPQYWGAWATTQIDEILLDHAHCEKKAASTALNLIFRYHYKPALMVPLSRLAREELSHFELVIEHIERRGGQFQHQHPSAYAPRLLKVGRKAEPERLLDTLLCCALIEARSCERMQLFAEALEAANEDPKLVVLYRGLLACEARHFQTYVEMARSLELAPEETVRLRLDEIAAHESEVVLSSAVEPRLHSLAPEPTTTQLPGSQPI